VPTQQRRFQPLTDGDNFPIDGKARLPERHRRWIRLVDAPLPGGPDPVAPRYQYGMWGEATQTVGTLSADFGYAGYYVHGPSGLNLTTYRAYSPSLGRWINRDPIGDQTFGMSPMAPDATDPVADIPNAILDGDVGPSLFASDSLVQLIALVSRPGSGAVGLDPDVNLYTYVSNSPSNYTDRSGLDKSGLPSTISKHGICHALCIRRAHDAWSACRSRGLNPILCGAVIAWYYPYCFVKCYCTGAPK
jgi:RHS repeat-associated protein